MAREHVKHGTIDACRECDETIIYMVGNYATDDGRRLDVEEVRALGPKKYIYVRGWRHGRDGRVLGKQECNITKENLLGHYKPRALPKNYCTQSTSGGFYSSGACHRPVKGEDARGTPMCGVHLAAARRREKTAEERDTHYDTQEYIHSEVLKLCKELAKHGLEAEVHYQQLRGGQYLGVYTGKVVVDPVKLIELLGGEMEEFS